MKKLALILVTLCLYNTVYSQESKKKVKGVIQYEYKSYQTPYEIEYKSYIYEGSGSYKYQWRTKGGEYGDKSSDNSYMITVNCADYPKPENKVFCLITDKITKNSIT